MESQPLASCRVVRDSEFLEQAYDESLEHRLKYRKHFPKIAVGLGVITLILLANRPGVLSTLYACGSAWIIWRGFTYRGRILAAGEAAPAFGKELSVDFFTSHLETTAAGEPIQLSYTDFDRFDVTPGGLFFVSGNQSIFIPKAKVEPEGATSRLEEVIRDARARAV